MRTGWSQKISEPRMRGLAEFSRRSPRGVATSRMPTQTALANSSMDSRQRSSKFEHAVCGAMDVWDVALAQHLDDVVNASETVVDQRIVPIAVVCDQQCTR